MALLLGVGAVIGIAVGSGVVVRLRRWALPTLLTLVSVASIGAVVAMGRRLRLSTEGLENVGQADVAGGMVGKLLLVSVIACAVALCAARLFDLNGRLAAAGRFHKRGMANPSDIAKAFMCFYVASSILPIFFGVQDYFHVRLVYPFFVYLAIFLWLPLHERDPVNVCKVMTGLIVFTSLLFAVVQPEAAIQPGYGGLIPGFNVRLLGTTTHANSLGAVTCGYILLEMAEPVRKRWMHLLLLGGAILCIILSQSKTSIIGVFAGASIIYGTRIWHFFNRKGRDYNGAGGQLLALALGVACLIIVIVAAVMMFGDGSMLRSLERKLNPRAVGDLSSGTGRLWIWAAAIDAGMQNPLFGQGADYWNLATRLRLGLSGAATAHNQYLQVFSLSGLVGLVTLLIFMGYLIRYAIRGAKASGNATIAMLVVLLLRTISETPIAPTVILAAEFFATTAYFIYIIDRGARPRRLATAGMAQLAGTMPQTALHYR
ncbi:O-antigen ligase family protein [Pseudoduganella buxea]|uniref:O-antigen ligase family protein n=1 Tax=Pseudoduganella buxea TaxID=1949069 RepID=UPI0014787194|nr:O-antigen ligase family protein [Pseudoduganella buxea]